MPKIAVIPGDGIGIDVTTEAVKIMKTIERKAKIGLELKKFDFGADKYLKSGVSIPEEMFDVFKKEFDAIFLGALGDPRIPDMAHARDILLGLRFKLDLYVNYRPVRLLNRKLCPLKDKTEEDVNFVVFRENTEGLYVGMGGIFKKGTPDEIAIQEDVNTRKGVERIIEHAFKYARAYNLSKVTMSDKSNVLRFGHDLWLRVFEEVGSRYPEIEKQHMYVDALTMQLIKRPEQFQVIVACNMFGDIITDLGAQLQGGMGLAASGNIHPGSVSLFEPVHGSAPKYRGQKVANPMAAILTIGIMLDHLGYSKIAQKIENAVGMAIDLDKTTRDLGGKLDTEEVGDYISEELEREL
ncbi:MAG: 3-isopropylmalate dehydrogenase [Candidatus Glassbacteria bacterium]